MARAAAGADLHFSPKSPDNLEVRDLFENYVPVNDKALSDSSALAKAWDKVRSAETDKQRDKAEKKLHAEYEKASQRQASLTKSWAADLAHVLPQTRTRQARTFPTVFR